MSQKAAVVLLNDWFPLCLVSVWNHPESEASRAQVAPRYFDVICRQKHYVDAMLRNGLGKKIHSASSPSHLSGGAFSVPKDLDRDRFIGDR